VLSWGDASGYSTNLYYALLDNMGNVLTLPMIFASDSNHTLYPPPNGQGNTWFTPPVVAEVTGHPPIGPSGSPAGIQWRAWGGSGAMDATYLAWDTVSHAAGETYAHSTSIQSGLMGTYVDTITLPASGPVYMRAFASADGQNVWSYTEAYPLAAGSYTSYIGNEQDMDWYTLTVASPQVVTVSLTNLPADYDLVLFTNLYTSTQ
jgi:hypothetical protein